MEHSKLHALINLLDDPDNEVFSHVANKLLDMGSPIIPTLENAWEESPDPELQERIEELIHRIQYDNLTAEFKAWAEGEEHDLFMGYYLVSKYRYPDLDEVDMRKQISDLKRAVWLEQNYHLTPMEQVNVFNHVLYVLQEFKSIKVKEPNPNHFYLSNVLESKTGNSLSLGILYLLLAQQVDMPVYGVVLPRFFVLGYAKHYLHDFDDPKIQGDILFYINAANRGTIFSRNEIKQYVQKLEVDDKKSFYSPIDNKKVIDTLLSYLVDVYKGQNEDEKVDELNALRALLKG